MGTGQIRLTPMKAQRSLQTFGFTIMPALTAGAMAAFDLRDAGRGAIVCAALLCMSLLVERRQDPLHLMPLGAFVVRALVPAVGLGFALVLLSFAAEPVAAWSLIAPLVGAWLMLCLAHVVKVRFEAARRIRIGVIGPAELAIGLAEELRLAGIRSHVVAGWIDCREGSTAEPANGPRRLGSFDQVREVVISHGIDFLVYSSGTPHCDAAEPRRSRLDIFERVAENCLDLPVRLIESNQLYEDLLGHVPLGQSNSAWFQYLLHPRYRAGSPTSKRAFDLIVGSAMLVILAPVLLVVAIAIKLGDGGPIFYRQRRVGEGGREFKMIKLRSMRITAEAVGARWAEDEDDRVTPIGRIIRRSHIDEMPQLWNVLCGEMTIVGPRPERREMIADLEHDLPYYDRRHMVKPGLAGWAQARCGYGGSKEGSGWKLCHDLYYLKHRSLYFDLLILLENVRVTLSGSVQFGVRAPQEQFIVGQANQAR